MSTDGSSSGTTSPPKAKGKKRKRGGSSSSSSDAGPSRKRPKRKRRSTAGPPPILSDNMRDKSTCAWDGTDRDSVSIGRFRVAWIMEVVLGPGATGGNGPKKSACKAADQIRRDLLKVQRRIDPKQIVKGHMLNENIGGPGISANLTPLTKNKNGTHEDVAEKWVKQLVGSAKSHHLNNPDDEYWYGVEYSVTAVYKDVGPGYPASFSCMPRSLKCVYKTVKVKKDGSSKIEKTRGGDPVHRSKTTKWVHGIQAELKEMYKG